jgi:hypothetical protein
MWRIGLIVFSVLVWGAVSAQDDVLTVEDAEIVSVLDVFGVEQQIARGTLVNTGDSGYGDVQIFAEAYDADNELIGEGLGFLANQCNKNVPLDFVLQPGLAQRFIVTLELFDLDTEIDTVTYTPQGRPTEMPAPDPTPTTGIIPAANREVAALEWLTVDEDGEPITPRVLYGEGCYRDIFTTYDWYAYTPSEDTNRAIEHPRAADALDETFRENMDMQSQFTEDSAGFLFNRSQLTYEPNYGTRAVFQTDINTLVSTELDGGFRRVIDDNLFRSTLQGINWINNERFLAYFYGAYGDGVTYLVASADAAYFSTREINSTPSVTVPTVTPNIGGVIVSGTFDGETTGFYIKPPTAELYTLWFEWENLPGNNYPAPVYRSRGGAQSEDVVYFALPDANNAPRLHCYDRREGELYDLIPLPFRLGTEDRAYMRLAPAGDQIALGANGVNGGLWLIDVNAFDVCQVDEN